MDIKQIKAVMGKTIPRKTSLNILRYALLHDGRLTCTDLDNYVVLHDNIIPNTSLLVDSVLFYKSLDLLNSSDPSIQIKDFPCVPKLAKFRKIDAAIFNTYDFTEFSYFTADNVLREILTGISFSSKDHFVASTDGLILSLQNDSRIDFDFIMRRQSAEILKVLLKSSPANCAFIGSVKGLKSLYLSLEGNGWFFQCKSIEGPYPDVKKVFPNYGTSGNMIDLKQRDILSAAIVKLLPYTNSQTHLVVIKGSSLYVKNRETKKYFQVDVGFNILPFTYAFGINAEFFLHILNLIKTSFLLQSHTTSNRSCIYAQEEGNKKKYLQMPLRILDEEAQEGSFINDVQFIKI